MAAYHFNILYILYAGRAFSFVEAAHIAVMNAYFADLTVKTQRKDKPLVFALLLCAFSLGSLIGNLVFANLFSNKLWQSLYISLGLRVLGFVMLILFIQDHPNATKTIMKLSKNPFRAIRVILKTREKLLICLMGIQFVGSLGASDATSAGFIYAQDRFNWGTQQYGNLSAGMLGVSIFCQLPLLWAVSRYVKEKYIVIFAYFYGAGIHLLLGVGYLSWMYITLRVTEGPSMLSFPAIQAIYSLVTPPDQLGTVYAAMSAISSLASFFGSLLLGDYFAYCVAHFPSPAGLTFPSKMYIGNIYLIGGTIGLINAILITIVFTKYFKSKNIKPRVETIQDSQPLLSSINSTDGEATNVSIKAYVDNTD